MTISTVLLTRAKALAAQHGEPEAGPLHVLAAANQLQAELLSARDALLAAPAPVTPPVVPAAEPLAADPDVDADEPAE